MTIEKTIDVLFVCYANIARSQMAEGIYRKKHPESSVSSGGVADYREKYNNIPHKGVIQVMDEIGIDIRGQHIDFINEKMVNEAIQIIVFCEKKRCPEYLMICKNAEYISLSDPGADIQGPDHITDDILQQLRISRDIIYKCIEKKFAGESGDSI